MTKDAIFFGWTLILAIAGIALTNAEPSPATTTPAHSSAKLSVTSVIIDYSIGRIDVNVSEAVDVRYPFINLARMMLEDTPGDGLMPLSGAVLLEGGHSKSIAIFMTESQRVGAIKVSSVPGGDGQSVWARVKPGFIMSTDRFIDMPEQVGIHVTEIPDMIHPKVAHMDVNFTTGIVNIYTSESIHPSVIPPLIYLENHVGDSYMDFSKAEWIPTKETEPVIRFQLPEDQRTELIPMSSIVGGDGNALLGRIDEGAFADIAGNAAKSQMGINVVELGGYHENSGISDSWDSQPPATTTSEAPITLSSSPGNHAGGYTNCVGNACCSLGTIWRIDKCVANYEALHEVCSMRTNVGFGCHLAGRNTGTKMCH